jgi:adenylate kinase family enzyme
MWEQKNTVLIYRSSDFGFKPSVAGCGLTNTILKNGSKSWEMWSPQILDKFQTIHESGGSIVFISNQYEVNVNTIKAKFKDFMKSFVVREITDENPVLESKVSISGDENSPILKSLPVMALFAMKKNCFKKPFTNMWKVLGFIYYAEQHAMPNEKTSIIIGGQNGGFYMKKKKTDDKKYWVKDFTSRLDTDRAFADNIGVKFIWSNSFFTGKSETKWQWNPYIMSVENRIKSIKASKKIIEPDFMLSLEELPKSDKYLIIIMGRPSSGKTTLSKRIIEQIQLKHYENYKINVVNDFKKKFTKKFQTEIKNMIFENTTIIICNYSDYKNRNKYIKLARIYEVPSMIVHMTTEMKVCKVLNHTKIQTSRIFELELHDDKAYQTWDKYYEEPEYAEDDITVVSYPLVLRYRPEVKFRFNLR